MQSILQFDTLRPTDASGAVDGWVSITNCLVARSMDFHAVHWYTVLRKIVCSATIVLYETLVSSDECTWPLAL